MGRKTYESIGRPLPGRTNIVITRQKNFKAIGATVVHSVEDALQVCKQSNINQEHFIIGGGEIFRQTLKICQRMYITEIQRDFEGDIFFPEFDPNDWKETQRDKHYSDQDNNIEYHFIVLDRKPSFK